jgi:hypothetical protein
MTPEGRAAALAAVDIISGPELSRAGTGRMFDALAPRLVNGGIQWDIEAVIEAMTVPLLCATVELAKRLEVDHSVVLDALREDIEAQMMPIDLGELETVWNQAPPTPHKEL